MRFLEMWWTYCHHLLSLNKLGSTTVSSCFVHIHGFSILMVSGQGGNNHKWKRNASTDLNFFYIEGVVLPLLRNHIIVILLSPKSLDTVYDQRAYSWFR